MSIDIKFNPTPDPDNSAIKKFLAKTRVEMLDALALYGNAYITIREDGVEVSPIPKDARLLGKSFTGVWIDENIPDDPLNIEKRLLAKLEACVCKPNKQKPKHTQPFWTKNWRKK